MLYLDGNPDVSPRHRDDASNLCQVDLLKGRVRPLDLEACGEKDSTVVRGANILVNLQGHDPLAGGTPEEEKDLRHLEWLIDGPNYDGHLVARFEDAYKRCLAPRAEFLVLQGLRET